MRTSRKRAITWTLVALGVVMIGLGAVLAATVPWSQLAGHSFGPFWAQGQAVPQAGPGGGYGYLHGWRFMGGPRFFGGGLLIAALVVLLVSLAVWRGRHGRYDGREERIDAEEILRRTFAEGRITEEEYKSRLSALRK